MSVSDTVARRGIREVLHFTTSRGLAGMLYRGELLSRARLREEESLEFILHLNAPVVRDPGWQNYVNLSISEINTSFFQISQRWHPDIRWAIAAFDPQILAHENVCFATTNNIWPRCRRGRGEAGLEALFAERVVGRYDSVQERSVDMPSHLTTHAEAEVLYPESLSTRYLRKIFVEDHELADQVHGNVRLVAHLPVDVQVDPARFTPSNWR
jgi:hypothetical protein